MTPADYQPKGFKACPFERFVFKNGELSYEAGKLQTISHEIMIEIKVDESIVKERQRVFNDTISSDSTDSVELKDVLPTKLHKESLNDREIDFN